MGLNRRAVRSAAERVRAIRLTLRVCLFAVVLMVGAIVASQAASADGDSPEKAPTPSTDLSQPVADDTSDADDTEPSGSEPSATEPSEPESDQPTSGDRAAKPTRTPSEKRPRGDAERPETPSTQGDSTTPATKPRRPEREPVKVRDVPAPRLTRVIPRTTAGVTKATTRVTATVDAVAAPAQQGALGKTRLAPGVRRVTGAVDTVTRTAVTVIDRVGDRTNERVVRPVEEAIDKTTDPIRLPLPDRLVVPPLGGSNRPEPADAQGSAPRVPTASRLPAAPARRPAAPGIPAPATGAPAAPARSSGPDVPVRAAERVGDQHDARSVISQTLGSSAGAQQSASAPGTPGGGHDAPPTGDAGIASSGGGAGVSAVIQADVRSDATEQVTVPVDTTRTGPLGVRRQPGFSPD